MKMATDESALYMSAPTSPRKISLENLCFFSVPTSPTRRTEYDPNTKPTSKVCGEGSISNVFDEFEFESSRRFNVGDREVDTESKFEPVLEDVQRQNRGCKEWFPAMAFADELFSDGKVMPLKPPPRLQYPNENKSLERQSSNLSSPRSPINVLKLPFQRRSLRNDDFDPFMVALENVKEDKVGKSEAKKHRRCRSMSPFREMRMNRTNGISSSNHHQQQQINEMGLILPSQQSEPNSDKRMENKESDTLRWVGEQNRERNGQEQAKQVKKSPIKLAEPKGVVFARKLNVITPTMESGETANGSLLTTCIKESRSQKFKNFIFRSGSMRRTSMEYKSKSSNATDSNPNLARKFSLKSMGLTQYNKEKRVSQPSKMTLLQYKPKLLLCMGYRGKYLQ